MHIGGGSIGIPGDAASQGAAPFNGSFSSLFPGAYLVAQSDLGLTYGGTLLASGTTPPVLTLTGALTGVPVPITIACTLLGARGTWTGTYSFDGGATTTAFTSAATIPFTGKGTGLTLNIAVGSAAIDNVWKATCSAWADQSGNAKNYAQATASAQPVLTVGYNGKPGLLFDGVDDFMACSVNTLLGFPYQVIVIARMLAPTSVNQSLTGTNAFAGAIYTSAASTLREYNGFAGPSLAFASTVQTRFSAKYNNSTADELRAGSGLNTGVSAGTTPPSNATSTQIASFNALGYFGNVEVLAVIYTPPVASLAALDAALNSLAGYGTGSIAV